MLRIIFKKILDRIVIAGNHEFKKIALPSKKDSRANSKADFPEFPAETLKTHARGQRQFIFDKIDKR